MLSSRLRASPRPALAPWLHSGAKRMVPPLLPPVLVAASYVPALCLWFAIRIDDSSNERTNFQTGFFIPVAELKLKKYLKGDTCTYQARRTNTGPHERNS